MSNGGGPMVINFVKLKRLVVLLGAVLIVLVLASLVFYEGPRASSTSPREPKAATTPRQVVSGEKGTTNYFASFRIEREQVRGRQLAMLQEIAADEKSASNARDKACARMISITEEMEKEMKAENLVKSRGVKECVVIIQPANTTIVVDRISENGTSEDDIKGLVSQVVGCSEDDLSLIQMTPGAAPSHSAAEVKDKQGD